MSDDSTQTPQAGADTGRLPGDRGEPLTILIDDVPVGCFAGETVAVALLADGVREFSRRGGEPRMPLCNMGTCFECGVVIDGVPLVRSCLTVVADGMTVRTSRS
ncbi:(2Fe-2S)-binding protein [Herbiconiux sp. A18JL235]|uniref:(2Fe-2S)-binding protein n=1 Tax=Herbiconiux sp. A18JL235 TaxID=3152363 RepID=A0AB39BJ59_9MICO